MPRLIKNPGVGKGNYYHKYVPGQSAYKRLYYNNHYKAKGLSFKIFMLLVKQDCFYCGAPPPRVNPYGSTWKINKRANKFGTYQHWLDCWITANGIDKMKHSTNYRNKNNLVSCCKICNWMKQRMGAEAFIEHCKRVGKHHEN